MRTLIAVLVAMAMLAVPTLAQRGAQKPTPGDPADKERTARAQKEQATAEKEYDEQMKRLPSLAPRKVDPWGNVRPANEPKR